jgi:Spy/CpxP family protein refolding chaperone
MRKFLLCASFVATGAVAGAAALHASGQPGGHTPPCGLHGLHGSHGPCELAAHFHAHLQQLHAELNLTDEQREAVHEVFRARRGELAAAVRPLLQAQRTIMNAVHADATDEAAIRTAADSLGRSAGDAAVLIARVKAEVLEAAALTPEQARTLGEIRAKIDGSIGRMLDSLEPAPENPR